LVRRLGQATLGDIENEARAITSLTQEGGHPNIVTIFKHGWLHGSLYAIDMELCDLSLDDYITGTRPLCQDGETPDSALFPVFAGPDISAVERVLNIWTIMTQVAGGLEFIHDHDQVHRDLKPSNSLLPPLLRANGF
jgi:serine/threonine protein kinase